MKKLLLYVLLIASPLQLNAGIKANGIRHVVVIGCDGFGGYAYGKVNMPNLRKLAVTGAWTTKARSVLPSSSAVNWASILMGAGIEKETVIMVVAGHGGIQKGHGGKSLQEVETPFVIYGSGIKKGYEIKGVVIDYDYIPTIAKILGLECPQAWRGVPVGEVFDI
ncbi:alkaline phosphatase family protein [Dysgonomonas sp. GY75]|uniref:alkaline phosphatase family protein n=1 Tax=Dysgonomonas sp. GY75 TaxID=2780419 RepID=UPI0018841695|nr:alkaline phosphatase family protein [Dysgonomonas sp. GY75]MBF0648022.1 alkaline phosphatase family protein [Dysgonomonas sp. GY75]